MSIRVLLMSEGFLKLNPTNILDCALVVTRYVNQLRYEKRDARHSRVAARQSAYDAFHRRFTGVASPGADDKEGLGLLHAEFNPYEAFTPPVDAHQSEVASPPPVADEAGRMHEEHGYGVGLDMAKDRQRFEEVGEGSSGDIELGEAKRREAEQEAREAHNVQSLSQTLLRSDRDIGSSGMSSVGHPDSPPPSYEQ